MLLEKYFDTKRALLNKALDEYLDLEDRYPETLHQAMRYVVLDGGKRLRPVLMIATYEMLIGQKNSQRVQKILPAACSIEFMHAASLVHDDLPFIDNASERRGKPSCHKKFGNAIAILTGDALIAKSFETLMKLSNQKKAMACLEVLVNTVSTRGMIGGEVIDIISSPQRSKLHVLRDIHIKKTGALLKAAEQFACILADASEQTTNALTDFALTLGLAYQIIDDLLDEMGEGELLGKEAGEDRRNEKVTYPLLLGIEESKKQALKMINDSYNIIKHMPNNQVLVEFLESLRDRIP
ncbi:MAG: polyprenyl synthetase family protein [Candidatus Cloacimonadia bacterium]